MPYNRYLNGVIRSEHHAHGLSREITVEYDFADLEGAVGAVTLTDVNNNAVSIPDNAIITSVVYEEITPMTSGGSATVALGITRNTDAFIAATAFNNAAFTADVSTKENEVPLKTSASVSVLATIATAALTAGKFRLHISYINGA